MLCYFEKVVVWGGFLNLEKFAGYGGMLEQASNGLIKFVQAMTVN